MKNFVLKPDTVTYTSLINFFCRNGQIDEAIELLKEMKENECEDDTVTFNVILGGLSREGRFDEALDMIEKLPRQATAPWRCHGGNRDKLCWLSHKRTFDEFVDRFGLLAPEVLDHSSDKSLQEQNFTIPVQPVNFSFKPGATSDTVAETVGSHKLNNGRNGLEFVRQPVMDWGVRVTIERKVDLIHFLA
ncbi:hypothetical protein KIW84_075004 [Lathyrus oleraceus]|uniref:Pentatricopeptide repeat-containing protein n=1 Tax=Pisum sativum TaxID=3888 RepID=A0A9D4VVL2_PEA|nr:hypothetical protein KIW84_075004 [Pisum sativum]